MKISYLYLSALVLFTPMMDGMFRASHLILGAGITYAVMHPEKTKEFVRKLAQENNPDYNNRIFDNKVIATGSTHKINEHIFFLEQEKQQAVSQITNHHDIWEAKSSLQRRKNMLTINKNHYANCKDMCKWYNSWRIKNKQEMDLYIAKETHEIEHYEQQVDLQLNCIKEFVQQPYDERINTMKGALSHMAFQQQPLDQLINSSNSTSAQPSKSYDPLATIPNNNSAWPLIKLATKWGPRMARYLG